MNIENTIERLAIAVETLEATLSKSLANINPVEAPAAKKPSTKPVKEEKKAPEKEEKKAPEKKEKEGSITEEDVRTALSSVAKKAGDNKVAIQVLKDEAGVSTIGKLEKASFKSVISACERVLDELEG